MDRRFLTVLAVSLVFALVVSAIFYQITARAGGSPKPAQAVEMKDVVIAGKPLAVGVTIKREDLKVIQVSKDAFPKGAFAKVEEVIERSVVSNILVDEPVIEGRLAARGSGLGLAPVIPVGMRAVSVRVNDVAGVAGFVLPGMRVDVLVTGRPPSADGTITKTCLQNILVLSAGQTMQPDTRGQAMPAPTVTLLATPEQAEILTLANSEGHIQLVLRNGSDQGIESPPGREVSELYGAKARRPQAPQGAEGTPRQRPVAVAVAPKAAPPPPPPPPDQVVVIRGNQRTVEVVGH
ncbi:MAG: Flp pilus assembly protein CpaB [Acidobacteria bacterium]|nr:Flp pilus assembly protein CpaB [Acidobacteriota bacterium]